MPPSDCQEDAANQDDWANHSPRDAWRLQSRLLAAGPESLSQNQRLPLPCRWAAAGFSHPWLRLGPLAWPSRQRCAPPGGSRCCSDAPPCSHEPTRAQSGGHSSLSSDRGPISFSTDVFSRLLRYAWSCEHSKMRWSARRAQHSKERKRLRCKDSTISGRTSPWQPDS